MAKYRERFNDRARAGTVAKQNALKSKRQKRDTEITETHLNEPNEKQQRLLELTKAQKGKVSSNKRKRLEKYIDRQVKKEERDELFEKLQKSSIDSSKLQSLKRLGATREVYKVQSESESESESEPVPTLLKPEPVPLKGIVDYRNIDFGFQGLKSVPSKRKKVTWAERLGLDGREESEEEEEESESNSGSDSSDSSDLGSDSESEKEEESKADSKAKNSESESESEEDSKADSESESESNEWSGFSETESQPAPKSQGQQFKEWIASQQEPREFIKTPTPSNYKHIPRKWEQDEVEDNSKGLPRNGTFFVQVDRSPEIKQARMALPVIASEQVIMETIHHHDVVLLTGETGSGKTSQVPQFLYEAGYGNLESSTKGMIGITQPRRVAAISMAKRVAQELGDHGDRVGYQIRFDSKVSDSTALKFMTDGVLLRELSTDFTLSKYSSIIVDEAHERSLNTDILIGILSRIVRLRRQDGNPLKLIIMSATLRVGDFSQNTALFDPAPPIVNVEARQYPVANHFNRKTGHDYVNEAVEKAIKIHKRLPKGGILIFLTGQNEISEAIKLLRETENKRPNQRVEASVRETSENVSTEEENVELCWSQDEFEDDPIDNYDSEDEEGFDEDYDGEETKLHILPLYSMLPTKEQLKVFGKVPKGHRLCIVATNVAETSLTIPGIRYVVDSGRSKQRVYDAKTGVQKFQIQFISKASADQRAGRAGRTGPGHCYRLYSSALYERDFSQFAEPEILRMPVEGIVLQMKALGIHNILNFPFPTPPPRDSLAKALATLGYLSALKDDKLTELGGKMSIFPLHPRHSKILLIGNQQSCLPYVVCIVAALSVGEIFSKVSAPTSESIEATEEFRSMQDRRNRALQRFAALDPTADVLKLLAAVAGYTYATNKEEYCRENFVLLKTMQEIDKLRQQLGYLIASISRPDAVRSVTEHLGGKLSVPSATQVTALKQIVAAGYVDQVSVRGDLIDEAAKVAKTTPKHRIPFLPLKPVPEKYVFLHSESVLCREREIPEYVVYSHLSLSDAEEAKVRMVPLCTLSAVLLSNISRGSELVSYSKPLSGRYAPKLLSPTKREVWVIPRLGANLGTGGVGWDLPPRKRMEVRVKGEWIEE